MAIPRLRLLPLSWLPAWLTVVSAMADGPRPPAGVQPPGTAAHRIDFDREIRPILSNHCFQCHGPDEDARQAELRLDVPEAARQPTDSGKRAIVPGKPEESELVKRIFSAKASFRMPPPEANKPLTDAEKERLRAWIGQGAETQLHWSFVSPRRPPQPPVRHADRVRNPIDRFILARLEAAGLSPAPEADRATLIRRVTLDLTGLPPTLDELDAFLADPAANAYEKVVDRLLSSPHYGERMALDWLDAARYADTHGYHIDSGRDMSLWREWVIAAFNDNVPFDRFTVEQVAGDLLPGASLEQRIASGFNRNHMINFEGGAIPEEYQSAYVVDRVNTTGTVWLGLTIGCAQCHDHKFDPIKQKEYYQLYAFFNNVPEQGLDGSLGNAAPFLTTPTPEQRRERDRLAAAIGSLEGRLNAPMPAVDAAQAHWEEVVAAGPPPSVVAVARALDVPPESRTAGQQAEIRSYFRRSVAEETRPLAQELAKLEGERQALDRRIPSAMVMEEMPRPRPTFLLERGQYDRHGEKVEPGVPAFLPPLPAGPRRDRLALARWLVGPRNPLVSRVAVNRIWQAFFGTGLVKTAEDFGSQGERPSHPELLDWLAVEFMAPPAESADRLKAHAWDVKALVRLIVTSATYRQTSVITPQLWAADPENRLLARGARLRLPAEFIRDQALAVSGLLDGEIGGRSVAPYQPPGLWSELASRADGARWTAQVYVQGHGRDLYRRGLYTFWKRTSPPPTMATFDAPDRETCSVRRARTNTPLQALILLNDPTYVEAARKLAERMMTEAGPAADERIVFAFRTATARRPAAAELAVLRAAFEEQRDAYRKDREAALKLLGVGEAPRNTALDAAELAAWSTVASMILNLDETVTKE